MSSTWLVVALVGAATIAIKSAGPVLLGGRPLPERLASVVELLAPSVLAALVVTQAVGADAGLALNDRLVGLTVAAIALWRRAPVLLVVVLAAGATALVRALG